ncbi:hypothetical protein F511_28460 [Dorcoceras hygrometricum]|uniref:Uncharacterized protein n=1 Tax=Dorcoceras hygrometricum TaxID=472368 RepID=A0A2Z7C6Z0_9LAMI|nr:hypothetical protein F511_28460 [Dorcoceras hygrometricum]
MSDCVSSWYFSRCVLVGSSSNADVDFRRWCFSCNGQQRALSGSGATKFCEQEPAAGSYQISRDPVCSNCCTEYRGFLGYSAGRGVGPTGGAPGGG